MAAIQFIANTDANDENEDLSALHYSYEFFARTDSLECEFWGVRLSLIKLREILETSPPQVYPPCVQFCIQSDNEVVVRYFLGFYVKITHDKVLLAQQCRFMFREMQQCCYLGMCYIPRQFNLHADELANRARKARCSCPWSSVHTNVY